VAAPHNGDKRIVCLSVSLLTHLKGNIYLFIVVPPFFYELISLLH